MAGGEDQTRIDPGAVSPATVSLLLLPAELERGYA